MKQQKVKNIAILTSILFAIALILYLKRGYYYLTNPFIFTYFQQGTNIIHSGYISTVDNFGTGVSIYLAWKGQVPGTDIVASTLSIVTGINLSGILQYGGILLFLIFIISAFVFVREIDNKMQTYLLLLLIFSTVEILYLFGMVNNNSISYVFFTLFLYLFVKSFRSKKYDLRYVFILLSIFLAILITYRTFAYVIFLFIIGTGIYKATDRKYLITYVYPFIALFLLNSILNSVYKKDIMTVSGLSFINYVLFILSVPIALFLFGFIISYFEQKYKRITSINSVFSNYKTMKFILVLSVFLSFILLISITFFYKTHTFNTPLIRLLYFTNVILYVSLFINYFPLFLGKKLSETSKVFMVGFTLVICAMFMHMESGRIIAFIPFFVLPIIPDLKEIIKPITIKKGIVFFLLISIITTTVLFTIPNSPYVNHFDNKESIATVKWSTHNIVERDLILTSFDLGSDIALEGHLNVEIPDETISVSEKYVTPFSSPNLSSVKKLEDMHVDYVVTANDWKNEFMAFNYRYPGLSCKAITKYDKIPFATLAYSTKSYKIYTL